MTERNRKTWLTDILFTLLTAGSTLVALYIAVIKDGPFLPALIIFLVCLYAGLILQTQKKARSLLLRSLMRGLIYGSLLIALLAAVFIIMLASAFHDGY